MRVCRRPLPGACPFLSGIVAGSTRAAAQKAEQLARAGVEGFAVFPPFPTFSGAPVPEEMIVRYHRAIAEAARLPIICFQFPKGWGPDYTPEILRRWRRFPSWSPSRRRPSTSRRPLQTIEVAAALDRPIGVLTGSDTFIFEAMVMGCNGALIGFAGTATARARRHERRRPARRSRGRQAIWEKLGPLARHLLAPADPRLPAAHEGGAALQGIFPSAACREPQLGVCEAERTEIAAAVPRAGTGAAMSLAGTGAVAIWHDIAARGVTPSTLARASEHMPERVSIPGFLRGRRFVAIDATSSSSISTRRTRRRFERRGLQARLNEPTPWTLAAVKHFRSVARSICHVASTTGAVAGGLIATLRWSQEAKESTIDPEDKARAAPPLPPGHPRNHYRPSPRGRRGSGRRYVNAEQQDHGAANGVQSPIIVLERWADGAALYRIGDSDGGPRDSG